MKKIAIILNSYHNAGPSNVMKHIMNYLPKSKYKIILITLLRKNSNDEIRLLKKNGIEIIELNYSNKKEVIFNAPLSIRKISQKYKIDIIHSNSLISDYVSIVSRAKSKHTCTLHNNMFYNYYGYYGKYFSKFMIKLHLKILSHMDLCVCCSKYVYDDISKYIEKSIIIRNGVINSTSISITREDLSIPHDALIYVYAGVLNSRKNTLWLARVFSQVHNPNEYLLILGEGLDKNKILQIDDYNIKVLGFVNNPTDYFNISDIYISASIDEGLPLSVLEAFSFGNYLLLSNIPSHKEIIELCDSNYVGNLFDSGNINSFDCALKNLRNKITEKNKEALQQIANKLFSAEKMAKEYEVMYCDL